MKHRVIKLNGRCMHFFVFFFMKIFCLEVANGCYIFHLGVKKETLEFFAWYLHKVQFTVEIEEEKFLSFLDVEVTNLEERLETMIYGNSTPNII